MIGNDELRKIWKEVMTYFKLLSQHFSEQSEENRNAISQDSQSLDPYSNPGHCEYEKRGLITISRCPSKKYVAVFSLRDPVLFMEHKKRTGN
jgi:hypothetical protein